MRSDLDRLCDRIGLRAESKLAEPPAGREDDDWASSATWWRVELKLGRRRLTVPSYGMGSALVGEPTPADVVSSLVLDVSCGDRSFEDFCAEFGYDVDSRAAERTWKQCAAMAPRVRRFLGDRFDEVAEAEH